MGRSGNGAGNGRKAGNGRRVMASPSLGFALENTHGLNTAPGGYSMVLNPNQAYVTNLVPFLSDPSRTWWALWLSYRDLPLKIP
uniref:Uncharacterized protein n=2 Tax=Picea TaxID=3328 RepID=A0A117NHZ4_PICGL|nr:hypothetical protein ABT39_MTgene3692 [Picea glauca]